VKPAGYIASGIAGLVLVPVVGIALIAGVADAQQQATAAATPAAAGGLIPGAVPAAYAAAVAKAGVSCPALSPALLAAQLQTESGWNPNAVSPVGAQGVAQFMPGTWPGWGRDENGDGTASALDPADAIPAAARYDCALAAQVAGVPGDVQQLMLAAYNAGPGAVLAAHGVPPIAETTHYVTAITRLAATYAAPVAVAAPATGRAATVIGVALSFRGTPYLWGGSTPGGFDCSGLTSYAYAAAGVTLPRTSQAQQAAASPVTDPRPGDLVFMGGSGTGTATHVGIVIGGGLMVDAPHPGSVVRVEPYNWPDLAGFGRVT